MLKLKIGGRLNLLVAAAIVGLALVLCVSVLGLGRAMRDRVADGTRKSVEAAYSLIAHYDAEARAGHMTMAQAQAAAGEAIGTLRYGDNDYFWINDMQPRMVVHPFKPELIGKDISGIQDPDGKYVFRVMTAVAREHGAGFVDYNWPKPGAAKPQPKISYVKAFKPWGWVVGTGVYVDDIEAAVRSAALTLGGIVLAIIAAMAGLGWLVSRSISAPVIALAARMSTLAEGDTSTPIPGQGRSDEVGLMSKALDVFRDAAMARAEAEAAKARADAEQQFVVDSVSERLAGLSGGDLTATIEVPFPESYAVLKGNYNSALEQLRDLSRAISDSTETIRTGSDEIASAADDLARRTESNAAGLEQTSAALSQMDGRLRATASSAEETADHADGAVAVVDAGRETANRAADAMGRVADSAKGIDSVIEGLDKIAFQTRVLAMNAAVEAGRAGEAGRGFAVVADLVSALAMRAEEEAQRARDQLTVTQTDIVTAVEAVRKVDDALADISGSVSQVHTLITAIAEDNKAQSMTIGEINSAMNQMDQATQQNAAMVEETSAASRNLASEVDALAHRARQFRVDGAPASSTLRGRRPTTALASTATH